jgi:hypothetical protein
VPDSTRIGLDVTQAVKRRGRGIARYIRQVVGAMPTDGLEADLFIRGHRWFRRRIGTINHIFSASARLQRAGIDVDDAVSHGKTHGFVASQALRAHQYPRNLAVSQHQRAIPLDGKVH